MFRENLFRALSSRYLCVPSPRRDSIFELRGEYSIKENGMLRHFIAGNFWLFVALALWIGKETVRTQPLRVAFFGEGNWFKPGVYTILVVAGAVLGVFF